ncbi:SpoIIE family protein phosphatase [Bacillus horti]|uniref:Negative regulator of sigma-B (Phosphoserine phosphatase) n=1 Tax=Caldalkalibacillus horti TaxID=77523 RepID=A0ABT9W4V0_9BACI|nr:SpoIIE family protein phosphatase [Bacillus horti]MDQ0168265.1 negative regulator of sigma-B (phosphoserine phosphatase) [Bacillus horti]
MKVLDLEKAEIAVFQRSKGGQAVCGDAYVIEETESYLFLGIADGLGSGEEAKKAADQAVRCFTQQHHLPVHLILQECNRTLASTRGAVAGVMKVDYQHSSITFAGIGNIQGYFYTPNQKMFRTVSKPGFLNGRMIDVQGQTMPYSKGTTFTLFSDGVELNRAFFDLRKNQKPDVIISELYGNHKYFADDLTIITGRALM